jgi:DNA-3-methyladenine glycosylase II
MARIALAAAIQEVAGRDAVLARLVDEVGPIRYPPRSPDGPFAALVRAIVFQQLAGAAARAILGRVTVVAGGVLSPEGLSAASDADLRTAGLSGNKLASLRDLCSKVLDGDVDLTTIGRQTDETVVAQLSGVRGIGPWTAEMFLLFELRRLDVWPVTDLGVRQGFGIAWGIEPTPTAKQLGPLGDPFRPYRSIVARYCWEAVARAPRGTDPSLR